MWQMKNLLQAEGRERDVKEKHSEGGSDQYWMVCKRVENWRGELVWRVVGAKSP